MARFEIRCFHFLKLLVAFGCFWMGVGQSFSEPIVAVHRPGQISLVREQVLRFDLGGAALTPFESVGQAEDLFLDIAFDATSSTFFGLRRSPFDSRNLRLTRWNTNGTLLSDLVLPAQPFGPDFDSDLAVGSGVVAVHRPGQVGLVREQVLRFDLGGAALTPFESVGQAEDLFLDIAFDATSSTFFGLRRSPFDSRNLRLTRWNTNGTLLSDLVLPAQPFGPDFDSDLAVGSGVVAVHRPGQVGLVREQVLRFDLGGAALTPFESVGQAEDLFLDIAFDATSSTFFGLRRSPFDSRNLRLTRWNTNGTLLSDLVLPAQPFGPDFDSDLAVGATPQGVVSPGTLALLGFGFVALAAGRSRKAPGMAR